MEHFGIDFFGKWSGLQFDVSAAVPLPASKIKIITTKPKFPPANYDFTKSPGEAVFPFDKTVVLIQTNFSDVWDLSENSQKFQVDVTYKLTWTDLRLIIDGYGSYGKTLATSSLPIWYPGTPSLYLL